MSLFSSEEKKALADSYALMMTLPAWKDLDVFARSEHDGSVKREDSKSARELTLGEVGEERGIRKGILKILKHAEQRREGV